MPYIAKNIEEYHYNIADDETNPDPQDAEVDIQVDSILFCIAREKREQKKLIKQAESQIRNLELWRDSGVERYSREIARQTERLQMYFLSLVAADPKLKTKTFSNGTIKVRKQQNELTIEDENAFIQVYDNDPDFHQFVITKMKKQINKKEIKNYIKKTGDVPDGCKLNTRDDMFSVTTN